jgi:hypothetical protein
MQQHPALRIDQRGSHHRNQIALHVFALLHRHVIQSFVKQRVPDWPWLSCHAGYNGFACGEKHSSPTARPSRQRLAKGAESFPRINQSDAPILGDNRAERNSRSAVKLCNFTEDARHQQKTRNPGKRGRR